MRLEFFIFFLLFSLNEAGKDFCKIFSENNDVGLCKECEENFTVNLINGKCESRCENFTYLWKGQCQYTCPQGTKTSLENKACVVVEKCPIMKEFGNVINKDGFKQIVILQGLQKLITIEENSNSIRIWSLILDPQNENKQHQMVLETSLIQHTYPVQGVGYQVSSDISSEKKSLTDQILIFSFSSTQFFVWSFTLGQTIVKRKINVGIFKFHPYEMFSSKNLVRISYNPLKGEAYINNFSQNFTITLQNKNQDETAKSCFTFQNTQAVALWGGSLISYNLDSSNSKNYVVSTFQVLTPDSSIQYLVEIPIYIDGINKASLIGYKDVSLYILLQNKKGDDFFPLIQINQHLENIIGIAAVEHKIIENSPDFVSYSGSEMKLWRLSEDMTKFDLIFESQINNQILVIYYFSNDAQDDLFIQTDAQELQRYQYKKDTITLEQIDPIVFKSDSQSQFTSMVLNNKEKYFILKGIDLRIFYYDSSLGLFNLNNQIKRFNENKLPHQYTPVGILMDHEAERIITFAENSQIILWTQSATDTELLGKYYHPNYNANEQTLGSAPKVVKMVLRSTTQYTAVYSDSTLIHWNLDRGFRLIHSPVITLTDLPSIVGLQALPESDNQIFIFSLSKLVKFDISTGQIVNELVKSDPTQFFDFVIFPSKPPYSIFSCDIATRKVFRISSADLTVEKQDWVTKEYPVPDFWVPQRRIRVFKWDSQSDLLLVTHSHSIMHLYNRDFEMLETASPKIYPDDAWYENPPDMSVNVALKRFLYFNSWRQMSILGFADNSTKNNVHLDWWQAFPGTFTKVLSNGLRNLLLMKSNTGANSFLQIFKWQPNWYHQAIYFENPIIDFNLVNFGDFDYSYVLFQNGTFARVQIDIGNKDSYQAQKRAPYEQTVCQAPPSTNCEQVKVTPPDLLPTVSIDVYSNDVKVVAKSNYLIVIDLISFKNIALLSEHTENLIGYVPDFKNHLIIFYGGEVTKSLGIWDYQNDVVKYLQQINIKGQENQVLNVVLDFERGLLFSQGNDDVVFVWNYPQGTQMKEIKTLHRPNQLNYPYIINMVMDVSTKQLIFMDLFNQINRIAIIDYLDQLNMKEEVYFYANLTNFKIDTETKYLYSFGLKGLVVMDYKNRQQVKELPGLRNPIFNIQFYKERLFYFGGNELVAINKNTLSIEFKVQITIETIYELAPAKDSGVIVVYMQYGSSLYIVNYLNGALISKLDANSYHLYELGDTMKVTVDEDSGIVYRIDWNYRLSIVAYNLKDSSLRTTEGKFKKLGETSFDFTQNYILANNILTNVIDRFDYDTQMSKQGRPKALPEQFFTISIYSESLGCLVYVDQSQDAWVMTSTNTQMKYLGYIGENFNSGFYQEIGGAFIFFNHFQLISYQLNLINFEFQKVYQLTFADSETESINFLHYFQEKEEVLFISSSFINIVALDGKNKINKINTILNDETNYIEYNNQWKHVLFYGKKGKITILDFNSKSIINDKSAIDDAIISSTFNTKMQLLIVAGRLNIVAYKYSQIVGIGSVITSVSNSASTPGQIIKILIGEQNSNFYVLYEQNRALQVRALDKISVIKRTLSTPCHKSQIIEISELNFVLIYCEFQIQLYRSDTLDLQFTFRKHNELGDIANIVVKQSSYLLIEALTSLWIFQIQLNSNTLKNELVVVNKFKMTQPKITSFITIEQPSKEILISIGGSSNGYLFQYQFTKNVIAECWTPISKSTKVYEINEQISQTISSLDQSKFLESVDNIYYEIFIPKSDDSKALAYTEQFQDSRIKSNINYRTEFIDGDINNNSNKLTQLKITNNFFASLEIPSLVLSDFYLNIDSLTNSSITFSNKTQSILIENCQFSSNFTNISFQFDFLESVVISKTQFLVPDQTNSTKSTVNVIQSSSLFSFNNTQNALIKDLSIGTLNFEASTIFLFDACQNLTIQNISVSNVNFDKSSILIKAVQTNYLEIMNSNLTDIQIYSLDSPAQPANTNNSNRILQSTEVLNPIDNYIIVVEAVLLFQINNIYVQNINNKAFIYSRNTYKTTLKSIILNQDILIITNSNFRNNSCEDSDDSQSLINLVSSNLEITQCNFISNLFPQSEGSVLKIQNTPFRIQNSLFEQNFAYRGGAILLSDISQFYNASILNSKFNQNTARSSGGAILIQNSDFLIINSSFNDNSAKIGGAIRYLDIIPSFMRNDDEDGQNNLNAFAYILQYNNSFDKNNAEIFGKNIASYPRKFSVVSDVQLNSNFTSNDSTSSYNRTIGSYVIPNFRSSGFINFKLIFKDEEDNNFSFSLSNFDFLQEDIKEELNEISIETYSGQEIILSGQTGISYRNFNETTGNFQLSNIQVISLPNETNTFFIETNLVKIPMPNSPLFSQDKVQVNIKAQFRLCMIGQVYKEVKDLLECEICPLNTYSIVSPIKQGPLQSNCLQCPEQADQCYAEQIILKNGFWRLNKYSDIIVRCQNKPQLCQTNTTSLQSQCDVGHIGPLCESCDTLGQIDGIQYGTIGDFNCTRCDENASAIGLYMFTAMIILVYVSFSIYNTLQTGFRKILVTYLRLMSIIQMSQSELSSQSNVMGQILMHYFQIVTITELSFVGLDFQIPYGVTFLPVLLGDPISSLQSSFDCAYRENQSFPTQYIQVLWTLTIPILYLFSLIILYIVLNRLSQFKHNTAYIFNGLIFLLLFLQPSLVALLIRVISCRKIGELSYIMEDIRYECRTDQHKLFSVVLAMPSILIWGLLIPLTLFYFLRRRKNILESVFTRLTFGFLYSEFKINYYFWQFFRIFLQILISLVYNVYDDTSVKHFLIFIFVFTYLLCSNYFQPINIQQINFLDQASHLIIIILVVFKQRVLETTSDTEKILMSILIMVINFSYIFYLLYNIMILSSQFIITMVRGKLYVLGQKYPHIKFLKEIQPPADRSQVYKNWNRLRMKFLRSFYFKQKFEQFQSQNIQKQFQSNPQTFEDDLVTKSKYSFKNSNLNLFKVSIAESISYTDQASIIPPSNQLRILQKLKTIWLREFQQDIDNKNEEYLVDKQESQYQNRAKVLNLELFERLNYFLDETPIHEQNTQEEKQSSTKRSNQMEPFISPSSSKAGSGLIIRDQDEEFDLNTPQRSSRIFIPK